MAVHTILCIGYSDRIFDVSHEVVGGSVEGEGAYVVESIAVVARTHSTGNLHLIVSGTKIFHGLAHIKGTGPYLGTGNLLLALEGVNLHAHACAVLPTFLTLEEVSIGEQACNICTRHVTMLDGRLQRSVHASDFVGQRIGRCLHLRGNVHIASQRIVLAGTFLVLEVILKQCALLAFEVAMFLQVSLNLGHLGYVGCILAGTCLGQLSLLEHFHVCIGCVRDRGHILHCIGSVGVSVLHSLLSHCLFAINAGLIPDGTDDLSQLINIGSRLIRLGQLEHHAVSGNGHWMLVEVILQILVPLGADAGVAVGSVGQCTAEHIVLSHLCHHHGRCTADILLELSSVEGKAVADFSSAIACEVAVSIFLVSIGMLHGSQSIAVAHGSVTTEPTRE